MVNTHVMRVVFKNCSEEELTERLDELQTRLKGHEPECMTYYDIESMIELINKEINTRHESKNQ
tara:strand:- start:422 stop:613 length:192 start_codon:yes stop_codon:yes gene_type:complete